MEIWAAASGCCPLKFPDFDDIFVTANLFDLLAIKCFVSGVQLEIGDILVAVNNVDVSFMNPKEGRNQGEGMVALITRGVYPPPPPDGQCRNPPLNTGLIFMTFLMSI